MEGDYRNYKIIDVIDRKFNCEIRSDEISEKFRER